MNFKALNAVCIHKAQGEVIPKEVFLQFLVETAGQELNDSKKIVFSQLSCASCGD